MDADIKGALQQLDKSYRAFEHKGKRMTKQQVKAVLEYGLQVGYTSTSQLKDKDIDEIICKVNHKSI
jgi:ribosomal protein L12E/L44/L45/RPP1/RPP2